MPKFKKKNTWLQQINSLLEIVKSEQEKINNKSVWQEILTNVFQITIPFKQQTYITKIQKQRKKEIELANLKTWLEIQKSSLPITKVKQIPIIYEVYQPVKNITIKQEKILSTHFLEVLWPKWFNYNLSDEEKKLLNTTYQNQKETVEKKFWKLLKEHMNEIKLIGVKSFVERHFQTKKDYSKIATMINQEVSLLSNITNNTNKNLNL